jgi:hypothetical protein
VLTWPAGQENEEHQRTFAKTSQRHVVALLMNFSKNWVKEEKQFQPEIFVFNIRLLPLDSFVESNETLQKSLRVDQGLRESPSSPSDTQA